MKLTQREVQFMRSDPELDRGPAGSGAGAAAKALNGGEQTRLKTLSIILKALSPDSEKFVRTNREQSGE